MKERLDNMQGVFNYDEFDSLEKFDGTHPIVMEKRIREKNWELNVDVTRKRFTPKKYFLYLLEKYTGIRPPANGLLLKNTFFIYWRSTLELDHLHSKIIKLFNRL